MVQLLLLSGGNGVQGIMGSVVRNVKSPENGNGCSSVKARMQGAWLAAVESLLQLYWFYSNTHKCIEKQKVKKA